MPNNTSSIICGGRKLRLGAGEGGRGGGARGVKYYLVLRNFWAMPTYLKFKGHSWLSGATAVELRKRTTIMVNSCGSSRQLLNMYLGESD